MSAYRNLKAWQHARRLAIECIRIAKTFPAYEQDKGGLADQLRRAVYSVVLNIAEGHNRISYRERRKFYETARTSLDEVSAILDLGGVAKYINEEEQRALMDIQMEAARTLYGLLRDVTNRLEAGQLTRARRKEAS